MSTEQTKPAVSPIYELVPMAHVADVEDSIRFYELLGFHVRDRVQHAGRTTWAWVTSGKGHLMLTAAGEPIEARRQAVMFYLYCDDVAAMRSHLLAKGVADGASNPGGAADRRGTVFGISHPFYMPEGELRVLDPDGYCLMIGQCELKLD